MLVFGAFTSAQALTNPPIKVAQGIEYMCGGRSGDEAAFMKTVSPRWAATLEFGITRSGPGVRFPSDVNVVVRERYSGREVMEASTGSPFMLARLNPGAYEVEATMGGVTLSPAAGRLQRCRVEGGVHVAVERGFRVGDGLAAA